MLMHGYFSPNEILNESVSNGLSVETLYPRRDVACLWRRCMQRLYNFFVILPGCPKYIDFGT